MAIRPVIFIGLGSSGAKIVSRIYENIERNPAVDPWIKPFYKYLGILSEVNNEPGVHTNLDVFHLTSRPLNTRDVIGALSVNANTREDFNEWWYKEAGGKPWMPGVNLGPGVAGSRIFGNLLLQHASLDPANNLTTKLRSLQTAITHAREALPLEEQQRVDMAGIDCHIFGLVAGGTCSGTLSNVALLVKSALGAGTDLFAALLLGDVCYDGQTEKQLPQQRRFTQHSNSCYALAELSVILSKTGFEIIKEKWPRHIGNLTLDPNLFDSPLFNYVTLVGAQNSEGRTFNAGGNQFAKYQRFVAEYFSEFFKSPAVEAELGRHIDDQNQAFAIDARNPSRPNRFARIGYVCVQLPREKILASLEKEISEIVGLGYFRNADPDRVTQGENLFLHETQWALLGDVTHSPFAPPAHLEPVIVASPGCPATADDFDATWRYTHEQVKNFYVAWMMCHSAEAAAAFTAFNGACKQALDQLMADYCGQSGNPLSLASLESLLEQRLIPLVEARIAEVNKELPAVQRLMSETGNAFESTIVELNTAFPSRINVIARKFWSGDATMVDTLTQYRDALRRYAVLKLTGESLLILLRDLNGMATVRKLIASYSAGKVFESKRNREQEVYSVPSSENVHIDVIPDRNDINEQLVIPLLNRSADNPTGGVTTLREMAVQKITSAWAGSAMAGQEGIFAYFQALCEMVRREQGNIEAQMLAQQPSYRQTIERIRSLLDAKFSAQCDSVFSNALSEMSVWDAIRKYVEQRTLATGKNPEVILAGLFKTYMETASLFTYMNNDGGDNVAAAVRSNLLYFLSNTADAVQCFDALGLANPATYLDRLMALTCVGQVNTLNAPESRDKLQLFQRQIGDLPYFYKGFEETSRLVSNPPVVEKGTEKSWSDARFPAWINAWHANADKPYWVTTQGAP